MDNALTRIVALFCAAGSAGLLWTFGVFVTVPWREGRLLALKAAEAQIIGASLLLGLVAAWGSLHILALADRKERPKLYAAFSTLWVALWATACVAGILWTLERIH